MKLKSLELHNFCGKRDFKHSFDADKVTVFGDNATGKSTLYTAITWLLINKPSTDVKNFTPKTIINSEEAHHLEHIAEATFVLDSGEILVLKKVFHEVYRTKKGSAQELFDGHTTDHYINGVDVQEKEYVKRIETITGQPLNVVRMLLISNYFPMMMEWKARRRLLLDICGDVSTDDVIDSDADLIPLREYLLIDGTTNQYHTVDEYKKIAANQKKSIDEDIKAIPNRIDEASRAMPNVDVTTATAIEQQITVLESEKADLQVKKANIKPDGDNFAAIEKNIAELKTKLAYAEHEHIKAYNATNQDKQNRLSELSAKQIDLQGQNADFKRKLEAKKREISNISQKRERLIAEYNAVDKRTFNENQTVCPTCGQELPADEIADLRSKFNLEKSKQLEDINIRGQLYSKKVIARLESEKAKIQSDWDTFTPKYNVVFTDRMELKDSIKPMQPFAETETAQLIQSDIFNAECGLDALKDDADVHLNKLKAEIDRQIQPINEKLTALKAQQAQIDIKIAQENRIAELEAEEKQLAAAFEKVKRGIYLCDLFTQKKVSMLDERINGKFSMVHFKMYNMQVNGGLQDTCEVLVPSPDGAQVPFPAANTAGRVNASLEIIKVLSDHYDCNMPIFVDNAEGVSKLIDIDNQVIRLFKQEGKIELEVLLDSTANKEPIAMPKVAKEQNQEPSQMAMNF